MTVLRAGAYLQVAGQYVGAVALNVLLLIGITQLWKADLTVPFEYVGDALQHEMFVKTTAETGWYLHDDRLGAPFGLDMHDFTLSEGLHFLAIKGLCRLFGNPFLVINLYYLLTFPLTAVICLFVFRHFGCSYWPALVGSQLFAFLPYHFQRGECHLFLSCYYLVPLGAMLAIWLMQDSSNVPGRRQWLRLLAGSVFCLMIGSAGVYYAFFTCFFLLVAGVAAKMQAPGFRALRHAALYIVLIAASFAVNLVPAALYAREHGPNDDAVRRNMGEAEHFGLRVAQLIVPVSDHRVPFLASVKASFNRKLVKVTENDNAALGFAGSFGFLFLILSLLKRPGREGNELFEPLITLNLFAVLLASIGSFGLLVAAAVPQIRCYNRLCVFIGFFSLFALVLLLDSLGRKLSQRPRFKLMYGLGLAVLLGGGLLDQAPASAGHTSDNHVAEFRQDAAFVRAIEARLPDGAMVYQMPYRVFLGGGSYDHLKLSLHSEHLRWSYPPMRGRPGDHWNRDLAAKPIEELLPTLCFAGFQGLTVDRTDYPERARQLEASIEKLLQERPIVSPDERFVFYDMTRYTARLRERLSTEAWSDLSEQALHPVLASWHRGFERDPEPAGRWCAADGDLELLNPSARSQRIKVHLACRTGCADSGRLHITGSLLNSELAIDGEPHGLDQELEVPPGIHVLHFHCDARRFQGDPKKVFRMVEFHLQHEQPSEWKDVLAAQMTASPHASAGGVRTARWENRHE